ncbi:MAG TPA: AMP-binding protein, partial [Flavipsychrobacter sp.]|nr:AMP-binding protein [Flavipsychrobacter sp.]
MNQPLNQLLGTYSFETAVENYPNHIAIYSDGQTITYHQLNEYALQLASVLRDYGITENAI